MPVNRKWDKQIRVYSYNGVPLSNRKEWTPDNTHWMNLSNTVRSETSQTQRNTYNMIPPQLGVQGHAFDSQHCKYTFVWWLWGPFM
jgi:hypothetical protein